MGFLLEYLRHPLKVGAVAPSSRFLAEKMLAPVDFSRSRTIVELGAGTGAFTRRILRRMSPRAHLSVFEVHPPFVQRLWQLGDRRMKIYVRPAQDLSEYVQRADAVISSLPLALFDPRTIEAIIHEVRTVLKPSGLYVQYQYGLKSYKLLQQRFSDVSLSFTPLNIPPAFVYVCKK
jgi:phospholipid N-methyltransferase